MIMNLIEKHGYKKLLSNVTIGHVQEVCELLNDFLKESEGWGSKCTACQAYILGMKQGVHDERQKMNR
jgi:hypothetical protein